jgi:hypothetical protein
LYKGSVENTETIELSIHCQILKDTISISLTNDTGIIVTDKEGNGGVYGANTTTTAEVRQGGEIMSGWTFSATPISSNSFSWKETSEGTFSITKITNDVEILTIKASKEGFSDLTTTFKVSKLKQGASTITCYVDSSAGSFFADNVVGTTNLEAKIFDGDVEIDPNGELLEYEWYFDGSKTAEWGTGKTVNNLNIAGLLEKTVYFIAKDRHKS